MPNRQGDYTAEPIFAALGKALSGWEGVNAAVNSLYYALHAHLDQIQQRSAALALNEQPKTHERGQLVRQAGATFLASNFGADRGEAAKLKKQINMALTNYVEWAARRNELAHGYVTEAQCPDYSLDEQPLVTVYALLPSHARTDRWYNAEPSWNYVAKEVEEFARQFSTLDYTFEKLALKVIELSASRSANS